MFGDDDEGQAFKTVDDLTVTSSTNGACLKFADDLESGKCSAVHSPHPPFSYDLKCSHMIVLDRTVCLSTLSRCDNVSFMCSSMPLIAVMVADLRDVKAKAKGIVVPASRSWLGYLVSHLGSCLLYDYGAPPIILV